MNKQPFSAFIKGLQRITRLATSNHAEWANPIPAVPKTEENMLDTYPTEKRVCTMTTAFT